MINSFITRYNIQLGGLNIENLIDDLNIIVEKVISKYQINLETIVQYNVQKHFDEEGKELEIIINGHKFDILDTIDDGTCSLHSIFQLLSNYRFLPYTNKLSKKIKEYCGKEFRRFLVNKIIQNKGEILNNVVDPITFTPITERELDLELETLKNKIGWLSTYIFGIISFLYNFNILVLTIPYKSNRILGVKLFTPKNEVNNTICIRHVTDEEGQQGVHFESSLVDGKELFNKNIALEIDQLFNTPLRIQLQIQEPTRKTRTIVTPINYTLPQKSNHTQKSPERAQKEPHETEYQSIQIPGFARRSPAPYTKVAYSINPEQEISVLPQEQVYALQAPTLSKDVPEFVPQIQQQVPTQKEQIIEPHKTDYQSIQIPEFTRRSPAPYTKVAYSINPEQEISVSQQEQVYALPAPTPTLNKDVPEFVPQIQHQVPIQQEKQQKEQEREERHLERERQRHQEHEERHLERERQRQQERERQRQEHEERHLERERQRQQERERQQQEREERHLERERQRQQEREEEQQRKEKEHREQEEQRQQEEQQRKEKEQRDQEEQKRHEEQQRKEKEQREKEQERKVRKELKLYEKEHKKILDVENLLDKKYYEIITSVAQKRLNRNLMYKKIQEHTLTQLKKIKEEELLDIKKLEKQLEQNQTKQEKTEVQKLEKQLEQNQTKQEKTEVQKLEKQLLEENQTIPLKKETTEVRSKKERIIQPQTPRTEKKQKELKRRAYYIDLLEKQRYKTNS